ncbi:hypothetical protein PHSC3_000338 [Chlamydiales bacterium STE3]|nr:hypothetical protein PHSC3_000338 [Chlamydiales bacterium STE3]
MVAINKVSNNINHPKYHSIEKENSQVRAFSCLLTYYQKDQIKFQREQETENSSLEPDAHPSKGFLKKVKSVVRSVLSFHGDKKETQPQKNFFERFNRAPTLTLDLYDEFMFSSGSISTRSNYTETDDSYFDEDAYRLELIESMVEIALTANAF